MAVQPRWRWVLWIWGVTGGRAWVDLDGDRLHARFDWWHLRTATANIERWTITGPYRWWRAIGLRSSWPFRDYAFDTNVRAGVDLQFRQPVPFARILRARVLTVTVGDPERFAAALAERGIPGEDLRRP
jgi:hypothetical protein